LDTTGSPSSTANDTSSAQTWEEFARAARAEATARNLRFLALGVGLIAVFTFFDLFFDNLAGGELVLRVANNLAVIALIAVIGLVLRSRWGSERVFGILFGLCAVVLAGQAYLLGQVSAAPGRLAFHYLAVLGLTMAGVQWFWQWQIALGVLAVALFGWVIPTTHPDYGFYLLSLSGSGILAAAFGRALVLMRYEQFALAARLRGAGAELAHHSAQLQAKNAEMRDFFYVLSHDLRAPLINLEGFSEELKADVERLDAVLSAAAADADEAPGAAAAWPPLRDSMNESLHFIRNGVVKMSSLVRGILELSRLESKPQEMCRVELDALVREVIDALQYQIAAKDIAVSIDPLPAVNGDPLRLSQVFGNLIDNAIKYMKTAGEARIDVRCRALDGRYEFSVRDSGIGIRREDQDKIFRLFSRLGTAGGEGEGIGLAAVKKIVERHGGTIWVESEPGKGTAISFTLPR
jgi:signal transduction histidine kinase